MRRKQKAQPAKKEKKEDKKKEKKEKKEEDGSRDLAAPPVEKKAPHPLAVLDKEAKSPFVGDVWKKVGLSRVLGNVFSVVRRS